MPQTLTEQNYCAPPPFAYALVGLRKMERGPERIAQGVGICKFCPHRMMGALEVRIDQNRFMPRAKALQTTGLIQLA